MLVAFIMGFACGLPLRLTMGVLQAWMKEDGVSLTVIGLFSLVQIPYAWKFLWAPVLDCYTLPFLGRRRGWLLSAQIALIAAIACLGLSDPKNHFNITVILAIIVAFFSATQDIVVDAYRREDLADEELGLGSSMYMYGYQLGTLLAYGGGLIMADYMTWTSVYMIMSACMLPCILTTLLCPEPVIPDGTPKTIKQAVFDPLSDYFRRSGALWVLAFIFFYKIGDTMAGAMTTPFYLDVGFSKSQIGAVAKIFGAWGIFAGAFVGGLIMLRLGINNSLWIFGILQAVSTACFAILAVSGPNAALLAGVVSFENLTSGMGSAAFIAFMASITNKRFTATQYALLTSFMAFPRVVASAPTGILAKGLGWEGFYILCTLAAIPGILLLLKFAPWEIKKA
ncbi:Major facilitator superfamily MFS_1 [uncultured Desulfobacterium sp.]|uniref:Major facilitator superfamily MFS_1 n=1 Tax=uncultured Desulfobacterium sp. TaxID=201089 RepID=A0A445N2H4_9BACT|nr:Major facilitator superfamily MFS_1 [uncultured Desulfobacterium sp.]